MSNKTDEIVEKLKQITLIEASELVKKIEETFGVDATIRQENNSGSATNTIKQDTNTVEEKTEFDVIIDNVQTAKRLTVIKVIRTITSLGLKEAKDIIESLPKTLIQGVSKEKAEETKKQLEEAGASVSLK